MPLCVGGSASMANRARHSAAATSPLDNDRTGNHKTEENQHHDWWEEPLTQFEFLDGGLTALVVAKAQVSQSPIAEGWAAMFKADALSCMMSREIAKARL